MTSREWKPGDVAMVTFDDASINMRAAGESDMKTSIALRREDDWGLPSYGSSIESDDARPLVVIDPEDREQVEAVVDAFWDHWSGCAGSRSAGMQAALRSLIAQPKPDEPTDLCVRVVADGLIWARVADVWVSKTRDPAEWSWLISQDDFQIEVAQ